MEQFRDYIITKDFTVSRALEKLQTNEYKLLFLSDESDALLGVLTDGDVRRFLLAGGALSQKVGEAAKSDPISVEGFHEGAARELLEKSEILCVPMTNEGRIHALVFAGFTLHRRLEKLDIPVVIMAGGLGTRLMPYTDILPKPLIPVGSKTITEQIIDRFLKFGCERFTLVVNYRRNLIKTYFSECEHDYEVSFADEDVPLGTGGGLCFLKGAISGPAFVTNCDSVIEADYADILRVHRRDKNLVTVVAAQRSECIPYGVLCTDESGALRSIEEKPTHKYLMNTGFYVIDAEFLDYVKENEFQPMTDIILRCVADKNRVGVYAVDGECFVDIGQLDDLRGARGLLS